jgi:hypothetical protein
MGNWCFNTVAFKGERHQIDGVKALFKEMSLKERKERRGQLPPNAKGDEGHFFGMRWDSDIMHYATKDEPNTRALLLVAEMFRVSFILNYEEEGMCLFGEATYDNGILTDVALDPEDFGNCEYQEATGTWLFEGEHYTNTIEILEILLERKKAIKNLQK